MIQKLLFSALVGFVFLALPVYAHAFDHTLPNNKFGIHLAQPSHEDLKSASDLVNSSGGRWGYVTLVIQENDRDSNKWQAVFDDMRLLHLIPIIRLATQPQGAVWKRPAKEDAAEWARFLNSLQWVVKNHYIVLFNEPNHAAEWGGAVDVEDYTQVEYTFAKTLSQSNPDNVVMMAGLDAAAPQQLPTYADEAYFLRTMMNALSRNNQSDFFDYIGALSSHSYPNPGFVGSPRAVGRNTIRTYDWELATLKSLGVQKELPVFITETGWMNSADPQNYKIAYEEVWQPDDRVMAVTPFVLNYIGEPFAQFSWRKEDGTFYPNYDVVYAMEKVRGDPEIIDAGFLLMEKPAVLVASSKYDVYVTLDNRGQAIWDAEDGYYFDLAPSSPLVSLSHNLRRANPRERSTIIVHIATNETVGKVNLELGLYRKGNKIATSGLWQFEVVPIPSLRIHAQLFGKPLSEQYPVEVQVFDNKEDLVYKQSNVLVQDSMGVVEKIPGVVLGEYYRVVLVKDKYLPRQNYVRFDRGDNVVRFEPMLPIDFDGNGHLDIGDLTTAISKPSLIKTLLGW